MSEPGSSHTHECTRCGEPYTCYDSKCDPENPVCSDCEWKTQKAERAPKRIPPPSAQAPKTRLEVWVTDRFLALIHEGMELGCYGANRSAFIREAIRHYVRYLTGEHEQKNVIEGVVEQLSIKRAQNLKLIEDAIIELKEIP